MKIEQRKVQGPEREPQVKQTALLASPIYIGQAQREEKKNIQKEEGKGFSSSPVFWIYLPSRMYFPLLSK